MNKTTFTLLLLSAIGLNTSAFAQSQANDTTTQEPPTSLAKPEDDKQEASSKAKDPQQQEKQDAAKKEDSDKAKDAKQQDKQSTAKKEDSDKAEDAKQQDKQSAAKKEDNKPTPNLVKEAAQRHTPPWTNDSANINLQQPRLSLDEEVAKPYTAEDFTIKPEWERLFASDEQVAGVVNHLRTSFGNQLDGDTNADDVARVRK